MNDYVNSISMTNIELCAASIVSIESSTFIFNCVHKPIEMGPIVCLMILYFIPTHKSFL